MSYCTYFSFSTGLSAPMTVPKGTLERILDSIADTEDVLGLTRTPEGEGPGAGWSWRGAEESMLQEAGDPADVSAPEWWLINRYRDARIERMARVLRAHNEMVRELYENMGLWAQKTDWGETECEVITPERSQEFWGGLQILELPKVLWTRDHYTDHMEHVYDLLSTGESRGISLDCEPFKPDQVAALVVYLDGELDEWGFDCRFAVPLDENLERYDSIASSYDGGYDWCSHCGPIHSESFYARVRVCPRAQTGECELKNEHPEEFEDEEEEGE